MVTFDDLQSAISEIEETKEQNLYRSEGIRKALMPFVLVTLDATDKCGTASGK